ncbi:hypothetical protein, partial [Pseudomonas amygdali]|uniref:hypothetical protein n=1 Tax=Pseudomonas amygdali TaxID=47877 RepID=UPI001F35693D
IQSYGPKVRLHRSASGQFERTDLFNRIGQKLPFRQLNSSQALAQGEVVAPLCSRPSQQAQRLAVRCSASLAVQAYS